MKQKLFSLLLAIVAGTGIAVSQNMQRVSDEDATVITVYQDCSKNIQSEPLPPSMELGAVSFTRATVAYNNNPPVSVSDTFVVKEIEETGEKVLGFLVSATLNLFSDGFGYDDNGKLSGSTKVGYILSIPGYVVYADYNLNKDVSDGHGGKLLKEGEHIIFPNGQWQTSSEISEHNLTIGQVDETTYLAHLQKAMNASKKFSEIWDYEKLDDYFNEMNITKEAFKGAQLFQYTYYDAYDDYLPENDLPMAIGTDIKVNIESGSGYMYMYNIRSLQATVKPLASTSFLGNNYNWGIEYKENEAGEIVVTNTSVLYDKDVTYISQPSTDAPARVKNNLISLNDIKLSRQMRNAPMPSTIPQKTPLQRLPRFQVPHEDGKVTVTLLAEGCDTYSSAQVEKGEMVSLKAEAKKYFKFLKWQDGNMENPRQIKPEGDKIYKAFFTEDKDKNYTPVSAQLVSAENGNVTITWTVENAADNYRILFESSATTQSYIKNIGEDEQGLTTFTYTVQMYGSNNEETIKSFSVQARTEDGDLLGNKYVVETDFTIPVFPYKIKDMQVSVDGNDVTVTWEKNNNVKFYYLIAYDKKAGYSRYETVITGENTHTFKLYVGSTYNIALFSYDENAVDIYNNSGYRGSSIQEIEVTAEIDYSPYNLQLSIDGSTATLEWDVPEGVDYCYQSIYDNNEQRLVFERINSDSRHYTATYTFTQAGTYSWSVVSGIESSSWFISVWKAVEPFEITEINPTALTGTNVENMNIRKVMRDGVMYILMPDGRIYNLQGAEVQ